MTNIYRGGFNPIQAHKQLLNTYKVKNISIKHRNYSSSKLLKTLAFDESKSQNNIEKNMPIDPMEAALEKNELKRYCINKFKTVACQEKPILKRKNSSLKLIKKQDTLKFINGSRIQSIKSHEKISFRKEDKNSFSNGRETHSSQQVIPVKRRMEILRLNKNRLKIHKDENLDKQTNKNDVSFEQALEKHHFQEQKIVSSEKIWSQNVLGSGLRKCSSSKIKILVKNPFEKLIRQQALNEQNLNKKKEEQSICQLKQSAIIGKLNESVRSLEHQQQIIQLLGMM